MMTARAVVTVEGGRRETREDWVIREEIYRIEVNGRPFVQVACLPRDLAELAAGFLLSEGVVGRGDALGPIVVDDEERVIRVAGEIPPAALERSLAHRFLASGCGVVTAGRARDPGLHECPKVASDYAIDAQELLALVRSVQRGGELFGKTGAAHTAALALDGRVAASFEDISRHNAVDKAIGRAHREGWELARAALLSSGRLSMEIVMKCAAAGIPIVASRTAPMQRGIEIAEELLVAVVGFARGGRMNIYTHPWRIR